MSVPGQNVFNPTLASGEANKSDEFSGTQHRGAETSPYVDSSAPVSDADSVDLIKKPMGVRKVEVIAGQYHKVGRFVVFFFIFLIAYAYGLDNMVRTTFQTMATNSYGQHSLLSTVNIVRSVVGAAAQPLIARLSDVFGRMELLAISVVFYAVGTIIMSQAYDVQRFAGGSIIYQIGYTGLMLVLQLIAADFSLLNWRLLASMVPTIPFIINTWISGNITADMGTQWSWGIGMWAIIVPVVTVPLLVCFIHMRVRAHKNGSMNQFKNELTDFQQLGFVKYMVSLFWKLDIIGVILMAAVLALILVPLTLAGGVEQEWKKAKIIAPLVIGFCCIPAFVVWEYYTPHPVTPFGLLKDRGVWSALLIGVFINFVWYMQGDYLFTVLQVAVNQSTLSATRITSLYSFVSTLTGVGLGFVVIRVKHVKYFITFGAIMWLVAMGMLIRFRGGESSYAGIIGSECLLGFGAGFFTYPTQASIQSCTRHEHMAVITALYLTAYQIGSGLGGSVSGAIWTQVLPKEIGKRLSNETLVTDAYGSPLTFILDYSWGTPERMAVVDAYRYIQKLLTIVGTCLVIPLIAFTFFLRNHKLDTVQSLEHGDEKDRQEIRY